VPTLNNRISYVQLKDAHLGSLGATLCPLGEGDVPVQKFLSRLLGIGYNGFVTFEWDRAWLPNIAPPEEALPAAIKKLKEWTNQNTEEKSDEKEAVTAH
jgi:sugar phosphate isomerase/epimerase